MKIISKNTEEHKELRQKFHEETGIYAVKDNESYINWLEDELLDLSSVYKGANRYAIEHLINNTYQVIDKMDGTCYKQGDKKECETYLNGNI